jgi:hypothetical protein
MIIVGDCLVSEDVVEKKFACNVSACKGACCIEGDTGAPLDEDELDIIDAHMDTIKTEMDQKGLEILNAIGFYEDDPFGEKVTTCKPNNECVFVVKKDGILNCAIEIANQKYAFGYAKPISCHLYPIRVSKFNEYHALNYHKWSICADACEKGQTEDIKIFEFAKDALVRKFGEKWYKEMKFTSDVYFKEKNNL